MFFVTFHQSVSNVYAYDDDGNLLNPHSPNVLDKDGDELRGIYLEAASGYLYVVSGGKKTSKVHCYQGSGTSYKQLSDFISPKHADSIDHPFAVAFDGSGNCYVSNQDTNVVAALAVSSDGLKGTPEAVAAYLSALYPAGEFLQGTLVASSQADLPNAPQTKGVQAVPATLGGLAVALDKKQEKVQNSVRDVAFYSLDYGGSALPLLFVADEAAGLVRVYDPVTGQLLRSSNQLNSPVHLLIAGGTIYVGAGDEVLSSPVPNPYDPDAPTWVFTPVALSPAPGGAVSGMAFDAAGNFHIAVRTNNLVMKYDAQFGNGVEWVSTPMPDNPEFLLYVAG
jgi:hypothetical protein